MIEKNHFKNNRDYLKSKTLKLFLIAAIVPLFGFSNEKNNKLESAFSDNVWEGEWIQKSGTPFSGEYSSNIKFQKCDKNKCAVSVNSKAPDGECSLSAEIILSKDQLSKKSVPVKDSSIEDQSKKAQNTTYTAVSQISEMKDPTNQRQKCDINYSLSSNKLSVLITPGCMAYCSGTADFRGDYTKGSKY